ncbi:protein FAR1-RELATED SEQUENCE 5-like [Argentina anserina]|uniref:protein FAR1-RELATED SEQUENCE 5-like n=1 Tax=Argentina anserina TaxID=57926 RepID=UPI002176377E|nr:protein FAR1-RELATED SEQUENCE 5-like [Potentilla anserina]
MAKALAFQGPETHHRLCIWHIYQNAATHLSSVFEKFKDFAGDFSSIIYDYEDIEDFLIAWKKLLEKYNMQENKCLKLFSDIGTIRIYEVTAHGKRFHHVVTFDSGDNTISCSCKKFEFAGILCSHALKVLSENNVKTIPSQYISKRWRKGFKGERAKVSPNANDDDQEAKIARRYRELA